MKAIWFALPGFCCLLSAQATYFPPQSSAEVLKGVPFDTGVRTGDRFRTRFHECDSSNTCDAKPVRNGCSKDSNRNSTILKMNGNVLFYDAKMGVDADGSPLSRKREGPNQPETSFRYPTPDRASVDADKVPYIVIPGGGFAKELGVELGDIAAVVYRDKLAYALVADIGPTCKIGEGSIALHEKLGHMVCAARNQNNECTKTHESSIEAGVLYFIFAGSGAKISSGLQSGNVNERLAAEGTRLMSALKGE